MRPMSLAAVAAMALSVGCATGVEPAPAAAMTMASPAGAVPQDEACKAMLASAAAAVPAELSLAVQAGRGVRANPVAGTRPPQPVRLMDSGAAALRATIDAMGRVNPDSVEVIEQIGDAAVVSVLKAVAVSMTFELDAAAAGRAPIAFAISTGVCLRRGPTMQISSPVR